jgi:type II secretory pathway pseudopilin PulG
MLAVVTLIGILAAVALPRIGVAGSTAKRKVCLQYRADINSAAEKFFLKNGRQATSTRDLDPDEYYGAAILGCPVDGSAYTLDPATGRVSEHNH